MFYFDSFDCQIQSDEFAWEYEQEEEYQHMLEEERDKYYNQFDSMEEMFNESELPF